MAENTLRQLDPGELARIGDLQLLARTVVQGFLSGMHRSLHTGSSVEFAQYRPYVQGDDPRFVDWRLYGRSDRLHIREFQAETNLRCTVLLDCSASMDYGSGSVSKFRYAQMLAACLSLLLNQQRDAGGFIAFHHELISHVPARAHPNQAHRILVELQRLHSAGATDADKVLRFLGDVIAPRGMVVLIADLLHPVDAVISHLRSLRARRHDVLVFQIADPAEQTFPFDHAVTLIDAEDGRERIADPGAMRAAYLENRQIHFDRIRRECLAAEIDIEEFSTAEPLDRALHHFLHRRTHSLLASGRRRSRAAAGGH